jgi:hypothetical protein
VTARAIALAQPKSGPSSWTLRLREPTSIGNEAAYLHVINGVGHQVLAGMACMRILRLVSVLGQAYPARPNTSVSVDEIRLLLCNLMKNLYMFLTWL